MEPFSAVTTPCPQRGTTPRPTQSEGILCCRYWHVKLDNASSMLTTFNTPHGRYRWLQMPFGLNSAPEEFQRRQNQTAEGLRGVRCVHDDILIFGKGSTKEESYRGHAEISEHSWNAVVKET